MGFCVNCRYHTTEKTGKRNHARRVDLGRYTAETEGVFLKSRGHYCTNPAFVENDFVTGEVVYADCYKKNSYDECVFYDDGETDIDDITENENTPVSGDTEGGTEVNPPDTNDDTQTPVSGDNPPVENDDTQDGE